MSIIYLDESLTVFYPIFTSVRSDESAFKLTKADGSTVRMTKFLL
jgi:hypothetical protein